MTVIAQDDHLTAEAWAASDATSAAPQLQWNVCKLHALCWIWKEKVSSFYNNKKKEQF